MPADCRPALPAIGGSIFDDVGHSVAFLATGPKPVTAPLPSSHLVEFCEMAAIVLRVINGLPPLVAQYGLATR